MNNAFVITGIILIALGLIGLALDYYVGLMWIFIILGAVSAIWGWLIRTPKPPDVGGWQN